MELCPTDGTVCQTILDCRIAKSDFDGVKVIGRGAFGQVQVVSICLFVCLFVCLSVCLFV